MDVYHGVEIEDRYRWLEEEDSPRTQEWCAEQRQRFEEYRAGCEQRPAIRARLKTLFELPSIGTPTPRRGRVFYFRRLGSENHAVLYLRIGSEPERVVLDPNAWSDKGTESLDWFYPTRDGQRMAYGRSSAGDELSTLYVLDIDSQTVLEDRIPYTRACSLSWLPDGSGFFYTRFPPPETRPKGEESYDRRVFFHTLGSDWQDDPMVFGEGLEPEHWPGVTLSPDGRHLLVFVSKGWSRTDVHCLHRETGEWTVLWEGEALFEGRVLDGVAYLTTNHNAPRYRFVAIDLQKPQPEHWRELIPESDSVLDGAWNVGDWIISMSMVDASSRLAQHDREGRLVRSIELPHLGSVSGLGCEWDGRELYYSFNTYTVPPAIFHLDLETGASTLWARVEFPMDAAQFQVEQFFFASRDGTRIPLFVVHPQGIARDGSHPALLTGYGGFNVSLTPSFSRGGGFWLQNGGIYAVANLRGGGEYGEPWHQAGMLARKQNVFDDFIGAAEFLIREGFTSPQRLAIQGGSNGGLLVGAALTQRPELFRAVSCSVPLLDMLRYHLFRLARLWIPEYGSSDDPEEFQALHAYSPYHRVRAGERYPAVLLSTGASDSRVDPMHARKMAALLAEANGSEHPILLRIEPEAGHGAGKPLEKVLDEAADGYAFLFRELGMKVTV